MAKKTSKKTEEQVINEVEITETVQETVKVDFDGIVFISNSFAKNSLLLFP